ATLYKHFESRTELLAGAYRTLAGEIDAFIEELALAAGVGGEPAGQLRNLLARCHDALDKGGARLARIPTILGVPEIEAAQSRAAKRRRAILTGILRPAADAGLLVLPLEEAAAGDHESGRAPNGVGRRHCGATCRESVRSAPVTHRGGRSRRCRARSIRPASRRTLPGCRSARRLSSTSRGGAGRRRRVGPGGTPDRPPRCASR